jgi:hypothetical protein
VLDIPRALGRMDNLRARRARSGLHRPKIRRYWPSLGPRLKIINCGGYESKVEPEAQIPERGTHEELLAADGLYTDLYQTQFAPQAAEQLSRPVDGSRTDPAVIGV